MLPPYSWQATGCVKKEAFLTRLFFCERGYFFTYWPFVCTHEQEFYLPFLFIFALLFPLYVIEVYFYFGEINLSWERIIYTTLPAVAGYLSPVIFETHRRFFFHVYVSKFISWQSVSQRGDGEGAYTHLQPHYALFLAAFCYCDGARSAWGGDICPKFSRRCTHVRGKGPPVWKPHAQRFSELSEFQHMYQCVWATRWEQYEMNSGENMA